MSNVNQAPSKISKPEIRIKILHKDKWTLNYVESSWDIEISGLGEAGIVYTKNQLFRDWMLLWKCLVYKLSFIKCLVYFGIELMQMRLYRVWRKFSAFSEENSVFKRGGSLDLMQYPSTYVGNKVGGINK